MYHRTVLSQISNLHKSLGSFSNVLIKKLQPHHSLPLDLASIENENKQKSVYSKYTDRTFTCGDLRIENVGLQVTLYGWLEFQRLDKFLILRDSYGRTQFLIKNKDKKVKEILEKLPLESILKVKGTVLGRPKEMINPKLTTGEIEVEIEDLEVLNEANNLPFNIRGFQMPNEALRMKYRYLDLRFPEMQKNLRARSELVFKMRKFLMESNFVDVETPTLFKATPGGAQEFIVPTQIPGEFYSLVQSPQQFKQILMAGAIDRYFQVARCYRDETTRPDRQPEFTQLDIEMSFISVDGILQLIEDLINYSWPDFLGKIPKKFERMKYADAMELYGSDKPDTSFDYKLTSCTSVLKSVSTNESDENFGAYFLQFSKNCVNLTNAIKNEYRILSKTFPRVTFIQNKFSDVENWISKMSKLFNTEVALNLKDVVKFEENSVLFLAYGHKSEVLSLLGKIRVSYVNYLEKRGIELRRKGMHLAWIVDFPLFELDHKTGNIGSAHHPFTAPNPEDLFLLKENPLKVRALAYDLVLNGNEIAGGSIRIHDPTLQEEIFKLLNIEVKSMKHILEMLSSGCPPHGGIAIGLDRFLSIVLNTHSIRDVIAFPKGAEGRDPLSGAPSTVTSNDLQLYHIKCIT